MRFDDSLRTVLAGDLTGQAGARTAWRQLVDLVGRERVPADATTLDRLRALRDEVPVEVRAASARALAFAAPPADLMALFAEDETVVAAPVLRTATLGDAAWLALLPKLDVRGRSVLRHRRDLSPAVQRGLESFGAADFVLKHEGAEAFVSAGRLDTGPAEAAAAVSPIPAEPEVAPAPVPTPAAVPTPAPAPAPSAVELPPIDAQPPASDGTPRFEIADLLARIDGFTRERPDVPEAPEPPASFLFETDAAGIVRWVEGAPRGALVGLCLARPVLGSVSSDAVIAGALRRRDRFADARLEIGGDLPASGSWRLSGSPLFDEATGRFTGMRGTGRRARRDQRAEVGERRGSAGADSLRQLVHELRTPANAIMGFSEMIEAELLGPVPVHYRARAGTIRDEAAGLVAAVEDLDTAARIEGGALDLHPGTVALAPLLGRVVDDLRPLAFLRGVELISVTGDALPEVAGDERAVERLVSRLLAAVVAAGSGERLTVTTAAGAAAVTLAIDRPRALETDSDAALFRLDDDAAEQPGAPLLGVGFTLRLARNLAVELGGQLAIEPARLTLRLPAVVTHEVRTAAN